MRSSEFALLVFCTGAAHAWTAGFDISRARHCAPTLTEESHIRTLVGATDLDGCHTFGQDMPGVDCVDSHRGPVVEGDPNSGRTQGGGCIGGDFAPASVIWDHVNSASSCTFYSDPECGRLLGEASELFSGCLVAPEGKQIQSFRCSKLGPPVDPPLPSAPPQQPGTEQPGQSPGQPDI